ncbi:MAG: helix-turn-helix domain-containing protein [Betaproteobacteria bacterium]
MKSTHSAQYRKLLAKMRAAREARGITQEEVARRLGRPQSYVSKAEMGERRLDVVEYLHFMRAIEGEPHALLRDIEREYMAERPARHRKRRASSG